MFVYVPSCSYHAPISSASARWIRATSTKAPPHSRKVVDQQAKRSALRHAAMLRRSSRTFCLGLGLG